MTVRDYKGLAGRCYWIGVLTFFFHVSVVAAGEKEYIALIDQQIKALDEVIAVFEDENSLGLANVKKELVEMKKTFNPVKSETPTPEQLATIEKLFTWNMNFRNNLPFLLGRRADGKPPVKIKVENGEPKLSKGEIAKRLKTIGQDFYAIHREIDPEKFIATISFSKEDEGAPARQAQTALPSKMGHIETEKLPAPDECAPTAPKLSTVVAPLGKSLSEALKKVE